MCQNLFAEKKLAADPSSTMAIDDEGDDELVLSSATQAALAEFLAERQAQESKSTTQQEEDSIDSFPEDWQVSRPSQQS